MLYTHVHTCTSLYGFTMQVAEHNRKVTRAPASEAYALSLFFLVT